MLNRHESGDTLVEILIATAILGMAVVGALAAMNFGQGVALNSVERTEVQGKMNSQLSYLRYARDMKIKNSSDAVWDAIVSTSSSYAIANPIPTNLCNGQRPVYRLNMFYINEFNGSTAPSLSAYPLDGPLTPVAATGRPSPGEGIWIEAYRPTPIADYIDFYVKACWSPSDGTTMQESRTVMRLYVPS